MKGQNINLINTVTINCLKFEWSHIWSNERAPNSEVCENLTTMGTNKNSDIKSPGDLRPECKA